MFFRRRLFFRIARIVVIFIIGLIVALFIALSQVNLETLRGDLVAILRDATHMPVEVDGDVSWKFSLRPSVKLNKVRIPNADWAKHKDGFTAAEIDVTLNLLSLLRDRPTIESIKIYDAVLFVEKNDKGEYSIMPKSSDTPEQNKEAASESTHQKYPFEDPGLGSVEVRNSVAHIVDATYSITGFQISYKSSAENREYSGWIKSKKKVFPFIISLSEYNAERKVYPVQIALSTGGDALIANIALEGKSKAPIDFIIKGDIPDISALAQVVDLEIPDMPAININLAGGLDRQKLTLRKSSVLIRGTELTVSGTVDWAGKIPVINAKLKSKSINLMELLPELYKPGKKWVRPNRDLNVFKDTSLYGKELLNHNITFSADIDNLVVYRDLNVENLKLSLKLKDGDARADLTASVAEGDIRTAVDIRADQNGYLEVRAAGIGERVYVGEVMKEIRETDFISELPVNFEFYLQGKGTDLSQLMSTVTGPIYLYSVAPGYAHSALVANMYGTDFLTALRHSIQDLFRSEKKFDQMKISCAAINIKVRNGVIETKQGVAAETSAINLRLAGKVDFGDEKLKLSLITVPVRGLKLSLTGNVVNSVEVDGNLAEPSIKISGAAVAGRVASATGLGLLLAPFTGGIGLVAGAGVGFLAGDLLENWLADDHPCKTAMNTGAPVERGDPEWLKLPMATLVSELIK